MRAKFYLSILFLLFFGNFEIFPQPLPEQDCIGAIPVCQDTFVQTVPYVGVGYDSTEIFSANSCLSYGEKNSVWYTFTVQTSGDLCFSIIPTDLSNDYDWAVFNLSASSCENIFTDNSLDVECSVSATPGITGANGLPGGFHNRPCIPVIAGEKYVVLVNRFSNYTTGYTLDFSASTAQLYDIIPPEMDSVVTPSLCGDTQLIVYFSENVYCSTVDTSDFILTGPLGNIPVSNVTSIECSNGFPYGNQFILTVPSSVYPIGNFSLSLLANADVQDLCNNPNVNTKTINFSVSPYATQVTTTPQLCSSNNGSATANPSGGISPYSYSWNSSPAQTTQTATGLLPGSYTVTITDAVGCISSGSGMVGFDPGANPPLATISASTNATCSGMNDGSASVAVTGGTPPYVYIWNTSPAQVSANATGLGTGTIICTVTDNNGCFDTATVLISGVNPIIISPFPVDTFICKGDTATLSASVSGGTTPYIFKWYNNGSFEGSNIPFSAVPGSTTAYSVFVTDNVGCMSDTGVINVNVFPPVNVDISPVNIVCPGQSSELVANASGGNLSGYSYLWNTGDTGSMISVSPLVNTTYSVTVSDNCTAMPGVESIDVSVGQTPSPVTVNKTLFSGCVPFDVQFQVEPFIQGYIYMWNFGEGDPKTTSTDRVNHIFQSEGCKPVTLSLYTNEGCPIDSVFFDSCMVNPLPSPTAAFTFSPVVPTNINPVVSFIDGSSGAETWQWILGDYSTSDDRNFQHEYADSGSYTVKLIVSNHYPCTDMVEHLVIVDYETTFYIPNSFTPNEDELNDFFVPVFEGIKSDGFNMYIFDRGGKNVYQSDSFNKPWDGKINGNYAQDGVYIYFIKYKTFKGEEKNIRGSVTLLK